jgi:hypothetical protein
MSEQANRDAMTARAFLAYPEPWDFENDEPVDDWGYAEAERRAYIAGWNAALTERGDG